MHAEQRRKLGRMVLQLAAQSNVGRGSSLKKDRGLMSGSLLEIQYKIPYTSVYNYDNYLFSPLTMQIQ
jgi:hypothetical protein